MEIFPSSHGTAATGGDLGEPEKILCDLSDRLYDFTSKDGKAPDPEALGFRMRGFGEIAITDRKVHSGTWALANERRFGDWCGISWDASDFIGQTVEISAWIWNTGREVVLVGDFGGSFTQIAAKQTGTAEWVSISGKVQIPAGLHSAGFVFQVREEEGEISPLYLDDMTVKLIGQEESFENGEHIASIRGAGHLPFITVVDNQSRDGKGHSLLVTRQEKDATVKFGASSYIGRKISVTAYVKTDDHLIRMGLDGAVSTLWTETEAVPGEWTKVTAVAGLSEDLHTAEIYLETDGNADFYVDDIFICPA